jgi:hypothetical protein
MVLPTFPNLKLWADALKRMEISSSGLNRVRPEEEKFSIFRRDAFVSTPTALRAAYVLAPLNQTEVLLENLDPGQKFKTLLYRTAGFPFLDGLGLRSAHFRLLADLSPALRLKRIYRPTGRSTVSQIADLVEADWRDAG